MVFLIGELVLDLGMIFPRKGDCIDSFKHCGGSGFSAAFQGSAVFLWQEMKNVAHIFFLCVLFTSPSLLGPFPQV